MKSHPRVAVSPHDKQVEIARAGVALERLADRPSSGVLFLKNDLDAVTSQMPRQLGPRSSGLNGLLVRDGHDAAVFACCSSGSASAAARAAETMEQADPSRLASKAKSWAVSVVRTIAMCLPGARVRLEGRKPPVGAASGRRCPKRTGGSIHDRAGPWQSHPHCGCALAGGASLRAPPPKPRPHSSLSKHLVGQSSQPLSAVLNASAAVSCDLLGTLLRIFEWFSWFSAIALLGMGMGNVVGLPLVIARAR